MIKKETSPAENTELAGYRRQIDEIDDKLMALLIERTSIVSKVGEMKRRTAPGLCPIRPAREADMIRRIWHRFSSTNFLPSAAAAIWRIIIGTSTSVEAQLKLSVYTPDRDNDLFWLAREYFGPGAPITRQPHVKRVIGDVMDGKAAVGIVPMLRGADTTYWWTNLMQEGKDIPKIFATIPFVPTDLGKDAASGLAIARLMPEASENDVSLLVFEADHNVSQSRLQAACSTARLDVSWINIATLSPATRHHLVEIRGFVTHDHPRLQSLLLSLGPSIVRVSFLGAYAVPVMAPVKVNDLEPKSLSYVPAHS